MDAELAKFSELLLAALENARSPVRNVIVDHLQTHEDIVAVRGDCPYDVVCRRPEDVPESETGEWGRRIVTVEVFLPTDDQAAVSVDLRYATMKGDSDGAREVSFTWALVDNRFAVAEVSSNDSATFKLDYFSVQPPEYIAEFVRICEGVFYPGDPNILRVISADPNKMNE